jgi:DUF1680 family protein
MTLAAIPFQIFRLTKTGDMNNKIQTQGQSPLPMHQQNKRADIYPILRFFKNTISYFLIILISYKATKAQTNDYSIIQVPAENVQLTDSFWLPKINTIETVTIPHILQKLEQTGRIKNFENAALVLAGKKARYNSGMPFDDSDVFKTIEGIAGVLTIKTDSALMQVADSLIAIIAKGQEPDGYLYTMRTIIGRNKFWWLSAKGWVFRTLAGKDRWMREEKMSHELYNAGHLYCAGAAYYVATGKRNLLDIALKNADLVCSVFGAGKRKIAPGHQVIELGLIDLYEITHKTEYLDLSKSFIEARGNTNRKYETNSKHIAKNGDYWQNKTPLASETRAVGHAVRAMYYYTAATEIAMLTGDEKMKESVERLWHNVESKQLYVQGGLGSEWIGESLGDDYSLPNETCYTETCASIGNAFWNYSMFMMSGDAKYIDVLEKSLYNNVLSGLSLKGDNFFYNNPLAVRGQDFKQRNSWFDVPCCPPNLTRLLPAVGGYAYAVKGNNLYVNLFIQSKAEIVVNKIPITITQTNNYPWNGHLRFTIGCETNTDFNLLIRIPGWATNQAMPTDLYFFKNSIASKVEIKKNGVLLKYEMKQGYAVLAESWNDGDVVEVNLPMNVEEVAAHPSVLECTQKIALQRGPVIYCAEAVDNDDKTSDIIIAPGTIYNVEQGHDLLKDVFTITAQVQKVKKIAGVITSYNHALVTVPYYVWANRSEGEMNVWFPQNASSATLFQPKTGGYKGEYKKVVKDMIAHFRDYLH